LLLDHVLEWITRYGYVAIFLLLVFGIIGLPIPDETMMTFAGYLVYKGKLSYLVTLLVAFSGSACGITAIFLLGRGVGLPLIRKYGRYLHFTEHNLARVHEWFERIGHWTLTFGYFIPGVRHFTAYVAGTAYMPYREFAAYAYSGALLWAFTFISLGYFFGEQWQWILERLHGPLLYAGIGIACVIGLYTTWKFLKGSR